MQPVPYPVNVVKRFCKVLGLVYSVCDGKIGRYYYERVYRMYTIKRHD